MRARTFVKAALLAYTPAMPPNLPLSVSLLSAVAVQIACQAFKVVFHSIRGRRLVLSWFISAGGMPSAHSAFVTALTVSLGLWNGFSSELFAMSFVFSLIIIYDAWRLRGAVGQQARALGKLLAEHPDLKPGKINEIVGHSLAEIAAGIAVGGGFSALVYLALRQP
jgi:hypothetical protein